MKRTNKGAQSCQPRDQPQAEFVEKRPPAEGNFVQTAVTGTQGLEAASIGLDRVREAAKRDKALRFTNLLHHINTKRLHAAYLSLNPKAAAGVDEVTWQEYGEGIEQRLIMLHDQIHSGRYRARASKRTWIPKPDGRQRPIGIAALEDKIVQQALVDVLQSIYEEDFLGFSYGSRPGRSQHNDNRNHPNGSPHPFLYVLSMLDFFLQGLGYVLANGLMGTSAGFGLHFVAQEG